jgi:hypothetical protein
MLSISRFLPCAVLLAALSLSACSPEYNWREIHGEQAPFTVLLPAKPSRHAQQVDLDGLRLTMSMTAAEVNGLMFAVGSAELPDPAQTGHALNAMKTAMLRNIGADAASEKPVAGMAAVDVDANGKRGGRQLRLVGRFAARGQRVYQAVIIGPPSEITPEIIETFLSSFKPGA